MIKIRSSLAVLRRKISKISVMKKLKVYCVCSLLLTTLSYVIESTTYSSSIERLNPTAENCASIKENGVILNFRLLQISDLSGWKQSSYTLELFDQNANYRSSIEQHKKDIGSDNMITDTFRGNGKVEDHTLCLSSEVYYSFYMTNLGPQTLNQEIGVFVCSKFISVGEKILLRAYSNGECSTFSITDVLPSLNIKTKAKSLGWDGQLTAMFSMTNSLPPVISLQPSSQPSLQPSSQPSSQPSIRPLSQPSSRPLSQPSSQPSSRPSSQSSSQSSSQPSSQSSSQPTSEPSSQTSSQPSLMPSASFPASSSSLPPSSPNPSSLPSSVLSLSPTLLSSIPSPYPSISPSPYPSFTTATATQRELHCFNICPSYVPSWTQSDYCSYYRYSTYILSDKLASSLFHIIQVKY